MLSMDRPRTCLHVTIVVVRVLAIPSLLRNAGLVGLDLSIGNFSLSVVAPIGSGASPCLCLAGVLGWASIVIILKRLSLVVRVCRDGIVILGALVKRTPNTRLALPYGTGILGYSFRYYC